MAAHLQLTELARVLHKHLTCPTPPQIRDPRRADRELREIEQALETPGTTIFIHGDLAQGRTPQAEAIDRTYFCDRQGERDFFVIDEFDEITTETEHQGFANFVRHIAEERAPIRFVLCSVSEPVRELLGAHESIYDYLATGKPFSTQAASGTANRREQAIEPGLPHRVCILSEKLFWEMFEDPTFARSLH
jgi:hypothetical protein